MIISIKHQWHQVSMNGYPMDNAKKNGCICNEYNQWTPLDHGVKINVDQDKDERLDSWWSTLKYNLFTT